MSFAQYAGRFSRHPLMQFGGAQSFSPEDKLLNRLGATSSQPVFGSQSVLTQELNHIDDFCLSQETMNSMSDSVAHPEGPAEAPERTSKGGDCSSMAGKTSPMMMLSKTTTRHDHATHQGTIDNGQAFGFSVGEHRLIGSEDTTTNGSMESLLNAVKLMERTTTNDDDGKPETLLWANKAAQYGKIAPANVYVESSKKSVRATKTNATRTKHVLQDQSPNRRATLAYSKTSDVDNLRRSTRTRIAVPQLAPSYEPAAQTPTKKKKIIKARFAPLLKNEFDRNMRATMAETTVPLTLLSATGAPGAYGPIAAKIAPVEQPVRSKRTQTSASKATRRPTKRTRITVAAAKPEKTPLAKAKKTTVKAHSIAEIMNQLLNMCPTATKALFVHMVLIHAESANNKNPPRGRLDLSFQWNHYPPLESIVLKNMARYYELSSLKNHFRDQFAFNNMLAQQVVDEATKHGWTFHRDVTTRQIRDRIRCYYKTLIQNAKKRLATMMRERTDTGLEQLSELWAFLVKLPDVQDYLKKYHLTVKL